MACIKNANKKRHEATLGPRASEVITITCYTSCMTPIRKIIILPISSLNEIIKKWAYEKSPMGDVYNFVTLHK